MMNLRPTGRMNQSNNLLVSSGFLPSSTEFAAESFQKTRRLVDPFMEQNTAQSVCPALAKNPRMTLDRWSGGNVWGTVHPRRSNSVTKFFGSSEKAVGGSRTIGYFRSDGRLPGVWPKHGVKTKASSTRESVAPSFICE